MDNINKTKEITIQFRYADGTTDSITRTHKELEFNRNIAKGVNYLKIINPDPEKEVFLMPYVDGKADFSGITILVNGKIVFNCEAKNILSYTYACNMVIIQDKLLEYIDVNLK